MIKEIKKILREYISELSTYNKPIYDKGTEHNIYANHNNPNVLYKVGNKDRVEYIGKLFNKYPDLFPRVYKIGKINQSQSYFEVEKLDTNRTKEDWKYLTNKLDTEDLFALFYYIAESDTGPEIYKNAIKRLGDDDEALNIFKRWVKLLKSIASVYNTTIDVHVGNFGYDKDGKLKCLDP